MTDFGLSPNPTDTLTLPMFTESFRSGYGHYPQKSLADSGYGLEENYDYLETHGIEAFVKYTYKEKTKNVCNEKRGYITFNISSRIVLVI